MATQNIAAATNVSIYYDATGTDLNQYLDSGPSGYSHFTRKDSTAMTYNYTTVNEKKVITPTTEYPLGSRPVDSIHI